MKYNYNVEGLELIKKCLEERPDLSPLFTAIDKFGAEDIEDIKTFYKEYVEFLKRNGETEEIRENAEEVANRNTEYLVDGNYSQEISSLWMKVSQSISRKK